MKTVVHSGKSIEGNRTRFIGQLIPADSSKQVRRSMVDIMRTDTVASVSHNIYAYRLPAKMDLFTRVLKTMANNEQDGPF